MVEIKLEIIARFDSPQYEEIKTVEGTYRVDASNYMEINYPGGLNHLNSVNAIYGLLYRYVASYKSDGVTKTYARILSWNNDKIFVENWSNGIPQEGRPFYVLQRRVKNYLIPSYPGLDNVISLNKSLIEDSLTIIKQYETLKKMDLVVSRASFDFVGTDEVKAFMDTFWTADKTYDYHHIISVHITDDNGGRFWGYVNPDNISYDVESNVYTIDSYDWLKFFLDTKGQNALPHYGNPTLTQFLSENFEAYTNVVIDTDLPEYFDWQEFAYYIDNISGGRGDLDSVMTVSDMFIEILKYYSAYVFFDGDKQLVFRNRNYAGSIVDINNKVIGDTLEKIYAIADYDSLLVNVSGEWQKNSLGNWTQWEGWALVWEEDSEMESIVANADLGNIPTGKKYLDLRQLLPYENFDFRVFNEVERDVFYENYKDLLKNRPMFSADLVGTNYELGNVCFFEGNNYVIKQAEIDYSSDSTKVLLERI